MFLLNIVHVVIYISQKKKKLTLTEVEMHPLDCGVNRAGGFLPKS